MSKASDVLRTPELIDRYFADLDKHRPADLTHMLEKAVWKGKFWFVADNEYPYNKIAQKHRLLIPYRVFAEDWQMTHEERHELMRIKREAGLKRGYDVIMENTPGRRTVARHYHLHLIKYAQITDYNHG